jgi:phage portal protein BeeE
LKAGDVLFNTRNGSDLARKVAIWSHCKPGHGGLTWKAAQISPEDAELLEPRKFGVEEICRIFQVPPPLVQDTATTPLPAAKRGRQVLRDFHAGTLGAPDRSRVRPFGFPGRRALRTRARPQRLPSRRPKTQWAAHAIALANNVLDPDEVRQVEGWNPRRTAE